MRTRTLLLSTATVAALLLAGCNNEPQRDRIASARSYLAKNNTRAAVIELKSELQSRPDSAEARLLLGQALLNAGDAATAIVELRKADDLKADPQRIQPLLARALLATGQDRKLVDAYAQTTLADPAAQADLQTLLATAYGRLNRADAMDAAIAAALQAVPGHAAAQLLRARALADRNDVRAALALVDGVTARDPANAEAWMLLADLRLRADAGDRDGALAALRRAVAVRNDAMRAHEAIVALLVQAHDIDGAAAHVEQLKKTLPDMPGTKLLQAQIAFQRGDDAAVRALTQPLLQMAPNDPQLLQLAGAAEYRLRAWGPAETLLAQAVRNAPALPLARQLLARVQLRAGQPEKTLQTLAPLLAEATPPSATLMTAGEAQLMLGDSARAEGYFARAAKAQPGDARVRTALAVTQLRKGDGSGGVAELERVAGADGGDSADKALIAALLARNDVPKALKAIDALERKQPDQPLAPQLRGRVQLLRGDTAAARASFERALAADGGYFPAVASLSALDLADKRYDAARQRLETLLRAQPKNQRAALALANVMARSGVPPAQVLAQLDAAIRIDPNDAAGRLELVAYQLGAGNAKGAADAAQQGLTAQPNNAALVGALGQAQLQAGEMQQAVTTFNRLAVLQPKSPAAALGLAEAQNGLKDPAAAERSLRHALELSPKLLPAQRALVGLMVADHRYDDALALARQAQAQRGNDDSAGIVLEGDIESDRSNWDAAIAAYRRALQRDRSPLAAIKLHGVLARAGRSDEAERFAAGWRKDNPQDAGFAYHLGDLAIGAGDWPRAETLYREVLRIQPEHALALNNVAWLMLRQGKPGALPLAQRANALQPTAPALRDTLALALASAQQLPQALQLQKETVDLAPGDPTLRLTLARLYLQSGDKATARTELEKLTKLGKRFRDQDEVSRLLATI